MIPEQLGDHLNASFVLDVAHHQGFGHWLQLIPSRNKGRPDRTAKPAELPSPAERDNLPSLIAEPLHHASGHRALANAPHADELVTRFAAVRAFR